MGSTKDKRQIAIALFLLFFIFFENGNAVDAPEKMPKNQRELNYEIWLKRSAGAVERINGKFSKRNIDDLSAKDKCEFLKEFAYIPFSLSHKSGISKNLGLFLTFGDPDSGSQNNITTISIEYLAGVPSIYEILKVGDDSTVKVAGSLLTVLNTKSKCGFKIELDSLPEVSSFVLN